MAGEQKVFDALDKAYNDISLKIDYDINSEAKYIIFSDHHKGVGDGSDDFKISCKAYINALNYYYSLGHTLILLGDVEELWEHRNQFDKIYTRYKDIYDLERNFYDKGRLVRLSGNHDIIFQNPDAVTKLLDPIFPGIKVSEGLIFNIKDGGNDIGEIILLHGHQGTIPADKILQFVQQEIGVELFWAHFQDLTHIYANPSPSQNHLDNTKKDQELETWASKKRQIVLCGHTHRPSFQSVYVSRPGDPVIIRDQPPYPGYFNSGCCSFGDGAITGIEIAGPNITHVIMYHSVPEQPRYTKAIKTVLDECSNY